MNSDEFWKNKIRAFLHDPPDKVLKIAEHEERAKRILQAIGVEYSKGKEDILASAVQRLTLKSDVLVDFYGRNWGSYRWAGYPHLNLPVSAAKVRYLLADFLSNLRRTYGYDAIDKFLEEVLDVEVRTFRELWKRGGYFAVWNNYQSELKKGLATMLKAKYGKFLKDFQAEELAEELVNLPAETRYPDHTIWAHLDLAAALSVEKPLLVRIKISPVQDFIKNARKEADLWAGSHMLSYLTFQTLKPLIEELGPDAVIYPHMRGQAFFEREFLERGSDTETANIPEQGSCSCSRGQV
jgi:CRISPR-associated protein Cmr2